MRTIIVGGVAGGASAAARLRRLDEDMDIVLLERGGYISYANCGLPYYIGGEITDRDELTLQTPESFRRRFRVDVRVQNEAVAIDPERRVVTVKDGATDNTYEETYDKLILSPGAEPVRPPLPGIDDRRVFTLRTIPDTFAIHDYITASKPRSAVVVGGGFIGLEMAENLKRAGLSVTVVEFADHVIGPLDPDVAADVHQYLRAQGVLLKLKRAVKAFHPATESLGVELDDGQMLAADLVLMSVGVRPDSALAHRAGIALNPRGAIVVDQHMRTSIPDIYAVGDAIEIKNLVSGAPGYIPLAGPANKQGRIAADHIAGIDSAYKGTQGSSVMKLFDMTIAATGLNEASAVAANLDYDAVHIFPASHAGYYPGATGMHIKALFDKANGRILGAQLVGFEGVDKRADVLATAIRAGMTAYDLTELELCYAPPFSSAKDPVNMLGFAIENLLTGKLRQFHWHDVAGVLEDPNAVLLDVRTDYEYGAGRIDGSLHIPLDDLRERLGELDRGKTIYVHCHSGLRSYVACRILSQRGFDCLNLSGGYALYELMKLNGSLEHEAPLPCGAKKQS